jgi:hypothetical protein
MFFVCVMDKENVPTGPPPQRPANAIRVHPFKPRREIEEERGLKEMVEYQGVHYPRYDPRASTPLLNAINIGDRAQVANEEKMKSYLNNRRWGFIELETLFEVDPAYNFIDHYTYEAYENMIDESVLSNEEKKKLKKLLKEKVKAYEDLLKNPDLSDYERWYIKYNLKPNRERNDPPPPSDDLTMEDLPRGMGDRSYGMDRINKQMRMYLLSDREDENMDSYIRRELINTDGEQLSHIFSEGIIPRVMKRLMSLDLPPNVLSEIKRRAVENAISYKYPLEEYDIPVNELIDILRAEYNGITTSDAWSRERAQRIINTINRVGLEEFIYPRRDRFGIPR